MGLNTTATVVGFMVSHMAHSLAISSPSVGTSAAE
eukprot:CAMPEP_0182574268 /NCGR_PEP_ID=MMETSP1324-20130603/24171_1 /TAXON_ID=236786 /ORGANISM="Florenciella sp., Strain RCC1587" /LENGTH=34 /DNA_ID= /DNA_START= /DNA_END= /DNA_ORIENTATION=